MSDLIILIVQGALLTVLEAGISGEPLAGGGAICGSRGEWSENLCTRWSLLAMAAFPVVRYHHAWEELPRDPTFMSETSAGIVARATRLRYQLSPYLYTQMYYASQTGMPITRPMAFEFYTDENTWMLDEQFMVGPSLMLAPIFQPADVSVKVYFPKPPTSWYHLLDGESLEIINGTGEVTLLSGENEMIMLQRGGHIIVMQVRNCSITYDFMMIYNELC
jgi:alpha-glucosidase (family GH31 glycosyl hydrolase)